ncbi:Retrovirus-related Pol polyprotein from transposon TNT 1-94 [Eumeta japonica]|uniref:Retrovirus-related Pol polyprotein from transposon TNT 1-94 n=1 Tax=Eumeta variegata TaxID=151549 RepID=A0A4C1WAH4_EUMVA|nr:Retrovirus-related Pol polyprotein from transposon TNT 1-94 [Eumeta japonica]
MYLVGYSENVKGYRLYDPILRDVIVGRDVVIMEKTDDSLSSSIGIEENRPLDTSAEKVPENDSDEENQHDETYVPDVASDSEDSFEDTMTLSPEAEDIISQDSVESLPEKRVRRKPDFYQSANMCVEMLDEHISLSDAMNGSEKDQWQSAMQQELESFRDNDSWELVDRPSEGTIVKNKWVFKKKHNTEGEVRYRARLVAKGFTQKKGIDYNETFSPVLKYSTFSKREFRWLNPLSRPFHRPDPPPLCILFLLKRPAMYLYTPPTLQVSIENTPVRRRPLGEAVDNLTKKGGGGMEFWRGGAHAADMSTPTDKLEDFCTDVPTTVLA